MAFDERLHGGERAATVSASLRRALEEDRPLIEQGISDFLIQRGGLVAASDALRASMAALRRHIYLEQELLFPLLEDRGMHGPIFAMSVEHADLWRTLDRMEEQLDDAGPWPAKQQTCQILLAEFERHTSKEDPIVFGHTEDVLASEEQEALRDFIQSAMLPPGWVCREPSID